MFQVVVHRQSTLTPAEPQPTHNTSSYTHTTLLGCITLFRRVLDYKLNYNNTNELIDTETIEAIKCHQSITTHLCIVAVPQNINMEHIIKKSNVQVNDIKSIVTVIHSSNSNNSVENRQVTLLLDFHTIESSKQFFDTINGNLFISTRSECAYVFYCSNQAITCTNINQYHSKNQSLIPLYHQLPVCPRCLARIDTSVTGIVQYQSYNIIVNYKKRNNNRLKHKSWWTDLYCSTCHLIKQNKQLLSLQPSIRYHGTRLTSPTHRATTTPRNTSANNTTQLPSLALPSPTIASLQSNTASAASPAQLTDVIHCNNCTASNLDIDVSSEYVLWICMICSTIGCGRYAQSHAVQHYNATQHQYAIDINNLYIWNYSNDSYIHRVRGRWGMGLQMDMTDELLHDEFSDSSDTDTPRNNDSPTLMLQNIQLTDHTNQHSNGLLPDDAVDEQQNLLNIKLQSVTQYYNQLLTASLETQYQYYQVQISDLQSKHIVAQQNLEQQYNELLQQCDSLTGAINELEKQNKSTDKSIKHKQQQLNQLTHENTFIRDLNMSMINDQKILKQQSLLPSTATSTVSSNNTSKLHQHAIDKDKTIAALTKKLNDLYATMDKYIGK